MLKKITKYLIDKFGYIVLKKGLPLDIATDNTFISLLKECEPYTMVSSDRSYAVYEAVKYLSRSKIEGDIVECGVWRGGQSMLMAYTLKNQEDTNRKLWLYDTYAGMSAPTEDDVYSPSGEKAIDIWKKENRGDHNEWCYASIQEVKKNMTLTGYPLEKIQFVKGRVEDTLPAAIPEKIAMLRLDTDLYESTCHELEHLYPKLVPGGVLYIDDYGSWSGSKRAVDEYMEKHQTKIMLVRVGMSRIGIKTE